jgi:carboxypeptidase Taq
MEKQLVELKSILSQVYDLDSAASALSWDQQTYMPRGGAADRGKVLGTLRRISHDLFTTPRVGELLDELNLYAKQLDPDSDDARVILDALRIYQKRIRVPAEILVEMSQATSLATQAWQKARQENAFEYFRPHLEKIIQLKRTYAHVFAPYEHIYDPLLDDYERGMTTREVQAIFDILRPQQVELIQKILSRPAVDDSFLHQPFDPHKQWDFSVEVITEFGYDWERGRLDKAPHPFSQMIGMGDVRITTRLYPDFFNPMLFGTMHETGHALYSLGHDPALDRTTVAHGASLALHESQSRMWENLVGRSYDFWQYFYPRLQSYFPSQLQPVSLEAFYRGINKVQPSLIRVEADEATYNLHIMLRLEVEIALMEGSLEPGDLPDFWNKRMQEYLGVQPDGDRDGVLQDIHWSIGLVGYFPTYALGNLVSAQLWECIQRDIPELPAEIRRGEFGTLLAWLRENIHRHGAKYAPQELVERVTGARINPAPYMRYLHVKYGEIYNL